MYIIAGRRRRARDVGRTKGVVAVLLLFRTRVGRGKTPTFIQRTLLPILFFVSSLLLLYLLLLRFEALTGFPHLDFTGESVLRELPASRVYKKLIMAKEKRSPWLAISVGCCASERRESSDGDGGEEASRAAGMYTSDPSSLSAAPSPRTVIAPSTLLRFGSLLSFQILLHCLFVSLLFSQPSCSN